MKQIRVCIPEKVYLKLKREAKDLHLHLSQLAGLKLMGISLEKVGK